MLLTFNDLARLRELAGKATAEPWILIGPSANPDAPGPIQWQHKYEIRTPDLGGKHDWPYRIAQSPEGQSSAQHKHDFTYIAALNPAVVVALLDRIEEAERRLREIAATPDCDWENQEPRAYWEAAARKCRELARAG